MFEIGDVEGEWTYNTPFNHIMCRDMAGSIRDWLKDFKSILSEEANNRMLQRPATIADNDEAVGGGRDVVGVDERVGARGDRESMFGRSESLMVSRFAALRTQTSLLSSSQDS